MDKKKIKIIDVPTSELLKYITLDEFADICRKKPATIKRRADEIPGVVCTNDGYRVLIGTRYPHKMSYTIDTSAKCRYILLRAISSNEYISYRELGMYEQDFISMLRQCEELGYIEKRDVPNQFGANGYLCTIDGEDFLRKYAEKYSPNKWERFEEKIPEIIAAIAEGLSKGAAQAIIDRIFNGNA